MTIPSRVVQICIVKNYLIKLKRNLPSKSYRLDMCMSFTVVVWTKNEWFALRLERNKILALDVEFHKLC